MHDLHYDTIITVSTKIHNEASHHKEFSRWQRGSSCVSKRRAIISRPTVTHCHMQYNYTQIVEITHVWWFMSLNILNMKQLAEYGIRVTYIIPLRIITHALMYNNTNDKIISINPYLSCTMDEIPPSIVNTCIVRR